MTIISKQTVLSLAPTLETYDPADDTEKIAVAVKAVVNYFHEQEQLASQTIGGGYVVIRLDGRGFTKLTNRFLKPFDERFHSAMVQAASDIFWSTPSIALIHTASDEVSIVLQRNFDLFNRRAEKLLSLFASEISSRFSIAIQSVATFDARYAVYDEQSSITDYIIWRMANSYSNAINGYLHHSLLRSGETAHQSHAIASPLSATERIQYLADKFNVILDNCPQWQQLGTVLIRQSYEKQGINPMTQERVTTQRSRIKIVDVNNIDRNQINEIVTTALTATPDEAAGNTQ